MEGNGNAENGQCGKEGKEERKKKKRERERERGRVGWIEGWKE